MSSIAPAGNERDPGLVAAGAGLEVRTDPLGGSPLARAAQAGTVPEEWYPHRPASADEWRQRAEETKVQFAAGAWYELLEPALDARGAAAERLRTVAAGAGVVVTTGQQPGLFGGPLYTWTKDTKPGDITGDGFLNGAWHIAKPCSHPPPRRRSFEGEAVIGDA